MSRGGWQAFREAAKNTVLELDRPAGDGNIGIAPPLQGPEPDGEDAVYRTSVFAEAVTEPEISPDIAPWTPDAPEILRKPLDLKLQKLRGAGHWSVLAIVPVAAAASLLAVRAGVNPYALCLEWWDLLFGSVFLTACLLFLVLAVWKPPMGRWHPGAPALIVAIGVIPLWAGANAAFGSACRAETPVAPAAAGLVPPLPPVIVVPSLELAEVPMPVPRPLELHYLYRAQKASPDLRRSVQLRPAGL